MCIQCVCVDQFYLHDFLFTLISFLTILIIFLTLSLLSIALGILTLLKFPYPRCVDEPDVYDSIRVHAEGGQADQGEKPVFAVRHTICARIICMFWNMKIKIKILIIYMTETSSLYNM